MHFECHISIIGQLAQAVGVPVGWRSQLATTFNGHYLYHSSPPFFPPPSQPFLREGVLGPKNLFNES